MKRADSTIIALILIILLTIVAATAAYYWLTEVQGDIHGGTSEYQARITKQISSRLYVADFSYNVNTQNAKVILENKGSRKIENIGSPEDTLVITARKSSCHMGFNSSTCDVCPFDLEADEIKKINIDFGGRGCAGISKEIEYSAYFALRNSQLHSRLIPALIYDVWAKKIPGGSPSARKDHAIGMIYRYNDAKIVLFGGETATQNYTNDTWVYDLSDNAWTDMNTPGAPSNRTNHAMATIYNDDKVMIFGGSNATHNATNETWVYDWSSNTWTNKGSQNPIGAPSNRTRHAMAAIYNDDIIVLFGGDNGTTQGYNDTWAYDLSNNVWTNKNTLGAPFNRSRHAMAMVYGDDKVVMFGGANATLTTQRYADTWVYDLSGNTWTDMNPSTKPSARYGHAMASVYNTDKVVMFGGNDSSTYDSEIWIYDLSDNRWTQKSPSVKPSARAYHKIATVYEDDTILLFGGDNGTYNGETWIYA